MDSFLSYGFSELGLLAISSLLIGDGKAHNRAGHEPLLHFFSPCSSLIDAVRNDELWISMFYVGYLPTHLYDLFALP